MRRVTPGKVVMLVGADGDRDATKRHDMGRTAVEGSDILVITDHHPRHEDPDSIRATLIAKSNCPLAMSAKPLIGAALPGLAVQASGM